MSRNDHRALSAEGHYAPVSNYRAERGEYKRGKKKVKRIKLQEITAVDGSKFKDTVLDKEGVPVMVLRKDSNGTTVMQVPRDGSGAPYRDVSPEPVYVAETKDFKAEECLPMLLKRFFFNIPREKLTRQDTIYGHKMFQNIDSIKDGHIELDDDVHKWIRDKLQEKSKNTDGGEQELGVLIFSFNLAVVEEALDQFERAKEPKDKDQTKEGVASDK